MIDKPEVTFILGNRKAKVICEPEIQMALKTYFRYRRPGYFFAARYQMHVWDGWIEMLKRGSIGTGLLLHTLDTLREKFDITIKDERRFPKSKELPDNLLEKVGDRDYQLECIHAMQAASRTGGLVICATAAGKTRIAGLYFASVSGNCLFIVDELTLMRQAQDSLSSLLGEVIGQVGNGMFAPVRVTVATIQTLHKRRESPEFKQWFKTVEVVIIDEIHVQINRRNIDVLDTINPLTIFGLTATLQLKNPAVRMPVLDMTGPVTFTYTMKQGIKEGHLAPGVVIRVRMTTAGGGKKEEYNGLIENNRERNLCAAKLALESVRRKHRVILFAERIDHLNKFSRILGKVKHTIVSGEHAVMEERLKACKQMEDGELPLIIANRVFGKGIDIPNADVVVDATGGSSLNGTGQRLGRLSRKKEGKLGFIHIDIVDKSPVSDKKSDLYNPFGKAARSRLQALRELGLPILNLEWKGDAKTVLDQAEDFLKKTVNEIS